MEKVLAAFSTPYCSMTAIDAFIVTGSILALVAGIWFGHKLTTAYVEHLHKIDTHVED